MLAYNNYLIKKVTKRDWAVLNKDESYNDEAFEICERLFGTTIPMTLTKAKAVIDELNK